MSEYRAGAVIPDQTAADQEVRPDFHNASAMAVTHEPFTGLAALVDTLKNEIEEVSSEAEVGLLKAFRHRLQRQDGGGLRREVYPT